MDVPLANIVGRGAHQGYHEAVVHLGADRYDLKSILVNSKLAFSEGPKVFGGDEKLTTALLDCPASHATLINGKANLWDAPPTGCGCAVAATGTKKKGASVVLGHARYLRLRRSTFPSS
jgi:hypothetical protein